MKFEGKIVVITSNSSVFLRLTKLFLEFSGKSRSEIFVVVEQGLPFFERFQKRFRKVGIFVALDEWMFTRFEAIFNHWGKAEKKYLYNIDITSFKPDILTDSVNKSCLSVLGAIKNFQANNVISIGSGFIPSKILNLFQRKINIHPGILPVYKGIGSPEAIMNFDFDNIGWSVHELIPVIDSGAVLYKEKVQFKNICKMTFAEVYIYLYMSALKSHIDFGNAMDIAQNVNSFSFYSNIRVSTYFKYLLLNYFKRGICKLP